MIYRIDHAAKALQRIMWVNEWQAREGDLPETHLADALVAQTEATLALAEQQRIANLIALAGMAEDDSKHEVIAGTLGIEAVWTLATTKMIGPDDEIEVVNPDIAAALGIKVPW